MNVVDSCGNLNLLTFFLLDTVGQTTQKETTNNDRQKTLQYTTCSLSYRASTDLIETHREYGATTFRSLHAHGGESWPGTATRVFSYASRDATIFTTQCLFSSTAPICTTGNSSDGRRTSCRCSVSSAALKVRRLFAQRRGTVDSRDENFASPDGRCGDNRPRK